MPTVITPSRTLAIPSVMINGLTLNTPIATPFTPPIAAPANRANVIASHAPRSLCVAAM